MYQEPRKAEEKEGIKTLFYPALHFNNRFPSDMKGEKGWIHMCVCACVWETERTVIEMCRKTMRARESWVQICAWGTQGRGECEI